MWRGLGVLLLGAMAGVFGMLAYEFVRRPPPGSDRPSKGSTDTSPDGENEASHRRSIMALGTIEPADGIVNVASPLIGFRVKSVAVRDGQRVKEGETLIELDPSDAEAEVQLAKTRLAEARERQEAEVTLARQRVASAELAVEQADDAIPLELEAQRSRIDVAQLKVRQASKDLQSLEELRSLTEPLASEQQVEHQRILLEGANAELNAAEVALKRLEQSLEFQRQTANAEYRAATQSLAVAEKGMNLESLAQTVSISQLKLAQTKITAAQDATIVTVFAHPGEVVGQQPLLQMADLDSLICEAEVDAADMRFLSINQPAKITSRTFPDTVIEGKVVRLGNVVSDATLRPLDPRQSIGGNVAKAVILFDPEQLTKLEGISNDDRRAALIGLHVDVEFPLAADKP